MQNQDVTRIARRRASAKFGFLMHLIVFTLVNVGLLLFNLGLGSEHYWFRFPLLGWAVGLSIHGLVVFLSRSGLRERIFAAELEKLERRQSALGVGAHGHSQLR